MTGTLVEFASGSRVVRQRAVASPLPILHNGPPGTFVEIAAARVRVSLPTDQIVAADDGSGCARVVLGGMRFDGLDEDGQLVFRRVRDLWPAAALSPERGMVMKLRPEFVRAIEVDGRAAWPEPVAAR